MKVLPADGFKVEDGLKEVGYSHGEEDSKGEEPEREVDEGGDVEELSGRACGEGPPQDGLATEAEADTEATDREAEEEGPSLVLWEEDVFIVLHGFI